MISRRALTAKLPLLTAGALLSNGCATTPKQTDARLTRPESEFDLNEFGFIGPQHDNIFNGPAISPMGSGESRHEEVRTAFKLLWDAPRTSDHMAILRYFRDITKVNPLEEDAAGNKAKYNEEWSLRANPLITSFFGMTNTLPSSGDQTPWCAAFVSFILYASGKPNMFSALSGSYRHYSTPTETPQYGDVVVFRRTGAAGDRGFGHVGFFLSENDTTVNVLGGNQRGGEGSTGAVVARNYLKAGSYLTLHSYRSVL